jgi:glyoxylase-like metal-dependent hydrolase (beta-lactamase superfamily II)
VRAVALHSDVIVATSRLLATNCTIVRGSHEDEDPGAAHETFVVDSPILPDELELLPSLLAQAGYAEPSGLLATHADWDHLLGPLAFPGTPLGCAESSAQRLRAEPGAAQRELRAFDETLYLERPRPLALGSVQALPVPGRCAIGARELELHAAPGHTRDGMAIHAPWARTLIAGDYVSSIEIPTLGEGGDVDTYTDTLRRLAGLLDRVEHVVPGHGPVLENTRAQELIAQDLDYLADLRERGVEAPLPRARRSREQRRLHAENAARVAASA